MASVTVNDYCAASNFLANDYIKNILKTKAEIQVDDANRETVNDALRKLTKNTNPTSTAKKSVVSTSPVIGEERVFGVGGGEAAEAAAPADLKMKHLVKYDRYVYFCNLSASAKKYSWSKLIDAFFKHIIFKQGYSINPASQMLLQQGIASHNYICKVAYSYHLAHTGVDQPVTLTAPPPGFIKLAGVYDESKSIFGRFSGIVESTIFVCTKPLILTGILETPTPRTKLEHTAIKIKYSDLFDGVYKQISDIDKRHALYSLLLFMVIHMTWGEIMDIITKINPQSLATDDHVIYVAAIERSNASLMLEFDDILPHCLFINTYTSRTSEISITLLNHDSFIQTVEGNTYMMRDTYETIVIYLYKTLIGKHLLENSFSLVNINDSISHYYPDFRMSESPSPSLSRINTSTADNYYKFTFYMNDDPVTFIPSGEGGSNRGEGVIVNRNNIAIIYRPNDNDVDTFKVKHTGGRINWGNRVNVALGTVAPKSHLYYNKSSRVIEYMDRLMGNLAELVYYPNDVVINVSDIMFQNNPAYSYIGPFDDDPCYPMAGLESLEGGEESRYRFVTYSRMHAWMKATATGFEVYVVTRGSKTGYDWHDADADIVSGYLNSDRSLKCSIILKQIMTRIESVLKHTDVDVSNKTMQIFSVGHSLGGYLSLALSHASVSRHIVSGISNTKITGGTYNPGKARMQINPYIIPIVFDPFITSDVIIKSFSHLPYARIHSVIAPYIGTFDVPIARAVTRYSEAIPKLMADQMPKLMVKGLVEGTKFMVKQEWGTWSKVLAAAGTVVAAGAAFGSSWIAKNRYADPACKVFVSYLKTQQHAGFFKIFEYVNSSSCQTISEISGASAAEDIRAAHHLEQINGLCILYLANHTYTDFYIETPNGLHQNMRAAHYAFNLPASENDIHTVVDERPITQSDYMADCIHQLRQDIDNIH